MIEYYWKTRSRWRRMLKIAVLSDPMERIVHEEFHSIWCRDGAGKVIDQFSYGSLALADMVVLEDPFQMEEDAENCCAVRSYGEDCAWGISFNLMQRWSGKSHRSIFLWASMALIADLMVLEDPFQMEEDAENWWPGRVRCAWGFPYKL